MSCYHSGDKVSLQTVFFQTKYHVAQAGLELTTQPNMTEPLILLLLSPQCWDYMPGLCGIMDQTQDFMRVRQVPYQLPYLPPSSAKRTAYVVGEGGSEHCVALGIISLLLKTLVCMMTTSVIKHCLRSRVLASSWAMRRTLIFISLVK